MAFNNRICRNGIKRKTDKCRKSDNVNLENWGSKKITEIGRDLGAATSFHMTKTRFETEKKTLTSKEKPG